MEDYLNMNFKDMLSAKMQKNNEERGPVTTSAPMRGHVVQNGYRVVQMGGEGYSKEPVNDIHEVKDQESEHSEKSLHEMMVEKNDSGFLKANGTQMGNTRYNMTEGLIGQAIDNNQPREMLEDASDNAWKQAMGDTGEIPDDEGYIPRSSNPHMTEEYTRIIDPPEASPSNPVGHNGSGMGGVRYDQIVDELKRMKETLLNEPEKFDDERWNLLIDSAQDALKQAFGSAGDDGAPLEIDEETGGVISGPTPNNPHQGEEIFRQDSKQSLD